MYTLEDVEKLWKKFDEIKEHAEQHDFVKLATIDIELTPLYNDLHKNWDADHARIFINIAVIRLWKFDLDIASFLDVDDEMYRIFQEMVIESTVKYAQDANLG